VAVVVVVTTTLLAAWVTTVAVVAVVALQPMVHHKLVALLHLQVKATTAVQVVQVPQRHLEVVAVVAQVELEYLLHQVVQVARELHHQ
jgi:hypothetical protein